MPVDAGFHVAVPLPDVPADVRFEETTNAVREAGEFLRQLWLDTAQSEGVNERTGQYKGALDSPGKGVAYPYDQDRLAVGVFNKAPHAWVIEDGHEPYNLAQRIRWGQTRRSEPTSKGWKIIIPFRHHTPAKAGEGASVGREKTSMPSGVHTLAKKMDFGERLTFDPSRIAHVTHTVKTKKGTVTMLRGFGAGRPRKAGRSGATYTEFGRLFSPVGRRERYGSPTAKSPESFAAAVADARAKGSATPPSTHHKTSMYEGLTKTGSPRNEQYMTWRTITPASQWWIPGRPGHHIARKTMDRGRARVADMIRKGFARDLERLIQQGLGAQGD